MISLELHIPSSLKPFPNSLLKMEDCFEAEELKTLLMNNQYINSVMRYLESFNTVPSLAGQPHSHTCASEAGPRDDTVP